MSNFPTAVMMLEKLHENYIKELKAVEALSELFGMDRHDDVITKNLQTARQQAAEIQRAADVLKAYVYPDPAAPILNGNKSQNMKALLQSCIDAWPQYLDDEPVNGGDMVEWFGEFREQVISVLAEPDDAPAARGDAPAVEEPEEDENPFDPETPEFIAFGEGRIDATGAAVLPNYREIAEEQGWHRASELPGMISPIIHDDHENQFGSWEDCCKANGYAD